MPGTSDTASQDQPLDIHSSAPSHLRQSFGVLSVRVKARFIGTYFYLISKSQLSLGFRYHIHNDLLPKALLVKDSSAGGPKMNNTG